MCMHVWMYIINILSLSLFLCLCLRLCLRLSLFLSVSRCLCLSPSLSFQSQSRTHRCTAPGVGACACAGLCARASPLAPGARVCVRGLAMRIVPRPVRNAGACARARAHACVLARTLCNARARMRASRRFRAACRCDSCALFYEVPPRLYLHLPPHSFQSRQSVAPPLVPKGVTDLSWGK